MTENRLPVFYRYRLLWHLLFWIAVFVLYWITYGGYLDRYYEQFILNAIALPARVIGTYIFIYLILPFAIEKKQPVVFGVLVLIHAVLFGLSIHASFYYTTPLHGFHRFSDQPLLNYSKIFSSTISNYAIPLMAATIVILKKWYINEQKRKKLAEEKVRAELNFLKAQVHPHFLFNTLNNLYALTLTKSPKTPEIVLKLSDLLDYMIYKSKAEFVPLVQELEIIKGYIELEKMRYSTRLDLNYRVTGEVGSHQIAPLVLLPFIENCFKHGASKDRANPRIDILLKIEPEYLHLRAQNSLPANKETDEPENKGIGLSNVKRRLELIYPGKHDLSVKEEERMFSVDLILFWKK